MPQVFVHRAPTWPLATHVKPLSARCTFHRQKKEKERLESFAIKGQSHAANCEGYAPLVVN